MKTRTVRMLHHLVIFFGFLFLVWGLVQYQSYTLEKDVGVEGVSTLVTEEVPPGGFLTVHTTSSQRMDTRVVRMDSRQMVYTGNSTYYDKFLATGGPTDNGIGKDVSLWDWTSSTTRYMIMVRAPSEETLTYNEADVDYNVDVFIWTPNFMLLIVGIVVISCTMVVGTVLGIGIFGPPRWAPGAAAPRPAPAEPREVPPVERVERAPAPEPVAAAPPPVITAPPARRVPPPAVPPPEAPFEPRYEVRAEEVAPPPMPARRGEPLWDVTPAPVPKPSAAPARTGTPLKKIKCSACGSIIPIYTNERPLRVTCPMCGRQGTLR